MILIYKIINFLDEHSGAMAIVLSIFTLAFVITECIREGKREKQEQAKFLFDEFFKLWDNSYFQRLIYDNEFEIPMLQVDTQYLYFIDAESLRAYTYRFLYKYATLDNEVFKINRQNLIKDAKFINEHLCEHCIDYSKWL